MNGCDAKQGFKDTLYKIEDEHVAVRTRDSYRKPVAPSTERRARRVGYSPVRISLGPGAPVVRSSSGDVEATRARAVYDRHMRAEEAHEASTPLQDVRCSPRADPSRRMCDFDFFQVAKQF